RPAGVLARQARLDRVVGHDLDEREGPTPDVPRYDRDVGEVGGADTGQVDPGLQAAADGDPAVHEPAPLLDRVGDHLPLPRVVEKRFGEPQRPSVQVHRRPHLPPDTRISPWPPSARSPLYRPI